MAESTDGPNIKVASLGEIVNLCNVELILDRSASRNADKGLLGEVVMADGNTNSLKGYISLCFN